MLSCHILVSLAIKWPSYGSIDLFSHKEQIKWPYRHTPTPKTSRPCSSPCQHWPQTPLGLILTPEEHVLLSVIETLRDDALSPPGDDLVTMVTTYVYQTFTSRNLVIWLICMICFVYIFRFSYWGKFEVKGYRQQVPWLHNVLVRSSNKNHRVINWLCWIRHTFLAFVKVTTLW